MRQQHLASSDELQGHHHHRALSPLKSSAAMVLSHPPTELRPPPNLCTIITSSPRPIYRRLEERGRGQGPFLRRKKQGAAESLQTAIAVEFPRSFFCRGQHALTPTQKSFFSYFGISFVGGPFCTPRLALCVARRKEGGNPGGNCCGCVVLPPSRRYYIRKEGRGRNRRGGKRGKGGKKS